MGSPVGTRPVCEVCGALKVSIGSPLTGKNRGKPVYQCPQCPGSKPPARTSATGARQKERVPGCPNCGADFARNPPKGETIQCSVCEHYFTYNRQGKLVECDELGTIYKVPRRRRRRKT